MKHIIIDSESVAINFLEKTYQYWLSKGALDLNDEELRNMPDGIRLIMIMLSRAKKLSIHNAHYKDLREPIWRCLAKTGGLSKTGIDTFGHEEAVREAAEADLEFLSKRNVPQPINLSIVSNPLPEKISERLPNQNFQPADVSDVQIIYTDVELISLNPLNATLYDRDINSALLASIEEYGVRVPVRITKKNMLLDGEQRLSAAKAAGWKKIPAIIEDIPEEGHLAALLTFNRYRIKTTIELLREYRAYLLIEKEKASARAGTRTDLGKHLPEGQVECGKARDLAAAKIGISGTSAELGLRILDEIEKREKTGEDSDGVGRMKVALKKSILGAAKLAKQIGWMDPSIKKRPKKNPPNLTDVANDNAAVSEQPVVESESSTQNSPTGRGWLTDEMITEIIVEDKFEKASALQSAIRRLRPVLYLEFGTKAAKTVAPKLRQLAQALTDLADKCPVVAK